MAITLAWLKQAAYERSPIHPAQKPKDIPLSAPLNSKATGKEGYIRVQWSPVDGADGYQVAIGTTQDMTAPDVGIQTEIGQLTNFYDYDLGNVALTRYFAVRAFQGFPPRFFSDFGTIVNATSVILTGAGAAEPASTTVAQSTSIIPPSGTDHTGGKQTLK